MVSKILTMFFVSMIIGIGLSALLALPVMWLWNGCLVSAINGVNEVSWLQSWGIAILAQILIKGVEVKAS